MPKIELKPNSADYKDGKTQNFEKACDFPGCPSAGDYKAPINRGLNDYYHFCFDHVKEYNQSWDFFTGMSAREVEEHLLKSIYGDRPTWKAEDAGMEDRLKEKAWEAYHGTAEERAKGPARDIPIYHHGSPEYRAMVLFNLEPPLAMDEIKRRYKELAKKNHPDHNPDKEDAEELLKEINMAYTVLKDALERFEETMKS